MCRQGVVPVSKQLLHAVREVSEHFVSSESIFLFLIVTKGRRKETFYLTMHSTYFYIQLYGVRHMVKDHSDSDR